MNTYVLSGGNEGRTEQSTTPGSIAHEMFTGNEMGDLLAAAELEQVGADYESAEIYGYEDGKYDALLDKHERGTKTADVCEIFSALKRETVPLIQAISEKLDAVSSIFATLHESGRAIYEQGIAEILDRTPPGGGTSSGIHESQSRLFENQVGQSLGYWRLHYPELRSHFPKQLNDVDVEQFYRAINKVQPSFIRVDGG